MGIETEICQYKHNDKIWVVLFSGKIKIPVLSLSCLLSTYINNIS